jgi:hypothetical protein
MKIVRFQEFNRSDWDRVAALSSSGWLTHTSAWIDIEDRFFVRANLSFGLIDDGEVVGIQPLFLSEGQGMPFGERLLHSGVHRHTGLALAPHIKVGQTKSARKAAMKEIIALAELHDVDRIQLNAHNLAPINRSNDRDEIPFWVKDFGFQLGISFGPNGMMPCPGLSTLNADQLVDLQFSENELFAKLDNRALIRQSHKHGLSFEVSNDLVDLDNYVTIAVESAKRTGEELPPIEYYRAVLGSFSSEERAYVAFARKEGERLAGLILLVDKGAANFLAGVSLPDALKFRPNDFLHWEAIRWAKRIGLSVYRFGPSFPEVPRDWPIAKVSRFKTKFGSKAVPIIQGSLFRRPQLYVDNLGSSLARLKDVGRPPISCIDLRSSGAAFVQHHLEIFGCPIAEDSAPVVLYRPREADVAATRNALGRGVPVVAVLPSAAFAKEFGATVNSQTVASPQVLRAKFAGSKSWGRVRTLHSYMSFKTQDFIAIVANDNDDPVWLVSPQGAVSMVLVGTDLAADLLRYRQGDPAMADRRVIEPKWGFAGERPNYLFDSQLSGEGSSERPADWWCEALADALERFCGIKRTAMLPNGAAGAIVITGDDDQASLACYVQQREELGSLPVTYFLHPLTKHDEESLDELKRGRRLELGLHPDALDQPGRYPELFSEQANWFKQLTGSDTYTVRNHGFLNDGYWEHARSWIEHGVLGSSNLPGFDGRIVNGSLLPARLLLEDRLTHHWSILTAIGDGIVFVNGWDDRQSSDCIHKLADGIRTSGIPGVIVLNLHPENIEKTRGMHEAARNIADSGFVSWTLSECFDWFKKREQNVSLPVASAAPTEIG